MRARATSDVWAKTDRRREHARSKTWWDRVLGGGAQRGAVPRRDRGPYQPLLYWENGSLDRGHHRRVLEQLPHPSADGERLRRDPDVLAVCDVVALLHV